MSDERKTIRDCAAQLKILASQTGRGMGNHWPRKPGELMISNESGIKRLREVPEDGDGVSDIGPGFDTWRELWIFLRGMNEGLYMRRRDAEERWRRAGVNPANDAALMS